METDCITTNVMLDDYCPVQSIIDILYHSVLYVTGTCSISLCVFECFAGVFTIHYMSSVYQSLVLLPCILRVY